MDTKKQRKFFAYINHIKINGKSRVIKKFKVTDASVHDSQVIDNLLDEGEEFNADGAYTGQKQEKINNG